MSNLVERHGLECRKCFGHIVLPRRTPQGSSSHPWYWPKDETLAWFLHPNCGYLSAYSESDVQLIANFELAGSAGFQISSPKRAAPSRF
jgi:hypothetical protein